MTRTSTGSWFFWGRSIKKVLRNLFWQSQALSLLQLLVVFPPLFSLILVENNILFYKMKGLLTCSALLGLASQVSSHCKWCRLIFPRWISHLFQISSRLLQQMEWRTLPTPTSEIIRTTSRPSSVTYTDIKSAHPEKWHLSDILLDLTSNDLRCK